MTRESESIEELMATTSEALNALALCVWVPEKPAAEADLARARRSGALQRVDAYRRNVDHVLEALPLNDEDVAVIRDLLGKVAEAHAALEAWDGMAAPSERFVTAVERCFTTVSKGWGVSAAGE